MNITTPTPQVTIRRPTTAEGIAAQFHNDGQRFETENGITIEDVLAETAIDEDYRDGRGTDTVRYTFRDDSVLTIAGDCWDLGYLGCFCSRGAGHDESCTEGPTAPEPCDARGTA
jgi:hypothetical protein